MSNASFCVSHTVHFVFSFYNWTKTDKKQHFNYISKIYIVTHILKINNYGYIIALHINILKSPFLWIIKNTPSSIINQVHEHTNLWMLLKYTFVFVSNSQILRSFCMLMFNIFNEIVWDVKWIFVVGTRTLVYKSFIIC